MLCSEIILQVDGWSWIFDRPFWMIMPLLHHENAHYYFNSDLYFTLYHDNFTTIRPRLTDLFMILRQLYLDKILIFIVKQLMQNP